MTAAFRQGRIAYLTDVSDSANPYLNEYERSLTKAEWNHDAQDWDNGWCEAKDENDS